MAAQGCKSCAAAFGRKRKPQQARAPWNCSRTQKMSWKIFCEKDSGNTSSKKFEKRNTAISKRELAPFKEPCNSRRCFDICQYACYLSCGTSSSIPKASMAEIGVPDFVRFPGMELSKSFLRSLLLKDFTCTPHPRKICRECGETTKTDLDTSHYSDAKKTHQNLSSVVFFFPYLY